MKNFVRNLLMVVWFAALVCCSNESVVTGNESRGKELPTRESTVNEEEVISDRNVKIGGEKLVTNSDLLQSVFSGKSSVLSRGDGDASTDELAEKADITEIAIADAFENSTEEEKAFILEHLDEIEFNVEVVITSDATTDEELAQLAELREYNAGLDELYNNLATEEVELYNDGRSDNETINPKCYRRVNKSSRSSYEPQNVIKAYNLAAYFLMNNDVEEVKNICKLFGKDIDVSKCEKCLPEAESRGALVEQMFKSEKKNAVSWIKQNGKNGYIVTRGLNAINAYGFHDHMGLFDRDKLSNCKDARKINTKWARCILSSYPTFSAPVSEERRPERTEYASYEPLANFTDAANLSVVYLKNNPTTAGQKALNKAKDHFYGDGTKCDYDKWCTGYYPNTIKKYDAATETVKLTNASECYPNRVNYCSYIPWYGYRYGVGVNLDADIIYMTSNWKVTNSHFGNMKVPDDILYSCNNKYVKAWVTYSYKNRFGWTIYNLKYTDVCVYSAKTNRVAF